MARYSDPHDDPLYDPEDDTPDDELAYLGLSLDNPLALHEEDDDDDWD